MKLLHIIASMDPANGGPCQGIRNTNPELTHSGISREVVSLDAPDSSFIGMDDFIIHALGPARGLWQYSARLKPWLIANMPRFDVVIVNGLWLYSSFAGWDTMRLLRRNAKRQGTLVVLPKIYIMPHGMLDPYFQRAADRKIKAIRNWFYWKLIENSVVNDADGLFFTCKKEMELARQTFSPYHPKKEVNVGYGIVSPPPHTPDMKQAFEEICPGITSKPFLLFLSRIHPKKGVTMLIEAYSEMVKKAVRDKRDFFELVIAGPGLDSAYGRKIFKLVANNSLIKNHVFFTGMISGITKWGALYASEAFILPSHQENFGIAVVEAMACKKAVLVSNQINICDEIVHTGSGIVEKDSLDGTRNLLNKWVALTPSAKQVMANNSFNAFKTHFDIKLVAKHFISAIFNKD